MARAPGARGLGLLYPVFTGLGIVDTRGKYVFYPHRHSGYEVILVDRGTYVCKLNDVELVLGADEIVVVKPGDWHEDYCEPPLRYFGVTFRFDDEGQGPVVMPSLFADGVRPEMQRLRVDRRVFWPLVRRIQREANPPDEFSAHVQDALLLEFFWHLVRGLPRAVLCTQFRDLSFQQAFPQQLRRLFRAHAGRQMSVAEMAVRLGMSESSLAHRCTSMLGESPARAFLKYKMERAETLLRDTVLSVKEVGTVLGFEDPTHFSRTFRRLQGSAPSVFRQQHRRANG